MQVSTGPLLNTENKESSENRRTERQENEKSVWTGRSKPGVKVHLSLYITRIVLSRSSKVHFVRNKHAAIDCWSLNVCAGMLARCTAKY